jgi:hypothetical protein
MGAFGSTPQPTMSNYGGVTIIGCYLVRKWQPHENPIHLYHVARLTVVTLFLRHKHVSWLSVAYIQAGPISTIWIDYTLM